VVVGRERLAELRQVGIGVRAIRQIAKHLVDVRFSFTM